MRLNEKRRVVESFLKRYMERKDGVPETIHRAMEYSLFAGGKRLRPILVMAGCEICDGKYRRSMPFACAIEMIHTYSLIHDDLPAMDDDDYRRGKLTNHKVFGEGMAVLAGDGLLNRAYQLMLETEPFDHNCLIAVRLIARAAGVQGMIGGQVLDLENEGKSISVQALQKMHNKKTAALICASLLAGALVAECNDTQYKNLETYGRKLGLAFQIQDDILDVTGDQGMMGKAIGSDASKDKSTYVSLLGINESKAMIDKLAVEAKDCLEEFGDRAEFLKQLADYLVIRKY